MKLLYRAENLIDAHLVRHALEAADIDCFVSGQYSTGAIGELPVFGLVNVLVSDDEWEAAEAVIRPLIEALRETDGSDPLAEDAGLDWEGGPQYG